MFDTVFSRCPVGTVTEYIMRTGRLQEALREAGASFRLLQEMDVRFQKAHFTQEEPLHFRDGGNIPPIWAQSQGDRSVLLGVTFQHERRGFFARADAEIHSTEELRGKRVAIPVRKDEPVDFQKFTALCGVENILHNAGLTMSDVELVYIPCAAYQIRQSADLNVMKREFDFMTEEFRAVAEGKADAAFANSVKVVRQMREGFFRNVLTEAEQFDPEALNNNNPILITCTKRFVREHPDIVVLYLRELCLAAEQAEARPRDFIEAVCSGVYEATPEEMTEAYADDLTKIRRPELGERELDAVRRRCGYLYRAGCIERIPDLAAWADGSFLKAARESLKRDG